MNRIIFAIILSVGMLHRPALSFSQSTKRQATENELWQGALNKGLDYLSANDSSLNFHTFMLYDFLKLKFKLPVLKYAPDFGEIQPGSYPYLFRRLIDGNIIVKKEEVVSLKNSIDRLTASALYCDIYATGDSVLQNAEKLSDKGGYYLTHALFALQLMKENNCHAKNNDAFQKTEKQLLQKVVDFIEAREFMDDEVIESVAFLYYCRQDALVKEQWLNSIAALQLPDGGWMRAATKNKSNGKTTTLAVWALLEALHPEANDISWIKK